MNKPKRSLPREAQQLITSSDEESERLKSYENGCNSFVRKPVDFADFAETVARLGVYWLAINEPPPER